ncbi:MAG: phenylalanine--tRNA ligase subunit alpha [Patescibacteria group bacterium]|jgi:phenylalanyl-tRNA synthetase alpha chain
MINRLQELETECLKAFSTIANAEELEASRVAFLGRKGRLADIMSDLPSLSNEEKRAAGQKANEVKAAIEGAFEAAKARLDATESASRAEKEWLDISLPGTEPAVGHLHITSQAIEEISDIFSRIGFVRARHPEIDWDYYAFESLNMPKDHPARDDWETFFVASTTDGRQPTTATGEKGKIVLTPHTSNAQVREMEKGQLPIRMINIGKCYRRQSTPRHLSMFHQFEGLVIDKTATVTELKGVCDYFAKQFFGEGRVTRLRPYHFRFTEPSFELDISCGMCEGTGLVAGVKCKLCKAGWLELGGAGMVHPNVLKAGGLDPKEYQGFAFGWGVERTAMMRSGLNIDDIRIMYKNDLRFLEQF